MADLVLRYALDDALAPPSLVERWNVLVTDGGIDVGDARVLVLNLAPGMEIDDLVDRAAGAWIDVEAPAGARPDRHVLLLERVWVHPDHRGRGLGPVIGRAVVERLGRGCHIAVCFPAPFDGAERDDDEQARSVAALGAIWAQVGFHHWRDGVWILELD